MLKKAMMMFMFFLALLMVGKHDVYARMGSADFKGYRDMTWPVPGHYQLSSCFFDDDAKGVDRSDYHYALDIFTGSTDSNVVAAYAGTVVETVNNGNGDGGFGNQIVIKHSYKTRDGNTRILYTHYSHLYSYSVRSGQSVTAGQVIGKTGGTGYGKVSYAVHLDFQILTSSEWRNYKNVSKDPYATEMLSLPSNICKGGSTACCDTYIREVKALYEKPMQSISLTLKQTSSNRIRCEWTSISGATQYYVEIKDSTGKVLDKIWTKYLGCDFGNLSSGNTYTVRVDALKDSTSLTETSKNIQVLTGTRTIDDGEYRIVSAVDNTFVCEIENSSTETNANCQLYKAGRSNNQVFKFEYMGDGYYKITAKHSGKVLDAKGGGTESTTNVQQYPSNDSSAQRWIVKSAGDGYWYIVNKTSNYYLDLSSGNAENGKNIWIYTPNGSNAQRWGLVKENGNKVSFDLNGGKVSGVFYTRAVDVYNGGRATGTLCVYNIPNHKITTNYFGVEAAVNSDGCVIDRRNYGEDRQLTVPENGMIVSGHLSLDNSSGKDGVTFTDKLAVGDYVGFNRDTMRASAYHDVNSYLIENKYVDSGTKYGTLPVPEKDGFTFSGWYTAADGGTKITSDTTYSANKLYAHWTSKATDLSSYNITMQGESEYTYDGTAKKPEIIVKLGNTLLVKDRDYTVVYTDNVNAGTAVITVTGKNGYSGTAEQKFKINKAEQKFTVSQKEISLKENETVNVEVNAIGKLTINNNGKDVVAVTQDNNARDDAYAVSNVQFKAQSQGTALVRITAAGNGNYVKGECILQVTVVHDYEQQEKTEATCKSEGTITYRCKVCGDYYTEKIPSTGHTYKTTVVEPTCTLNGYTIHTCTVCGDTYKDTYVTPKGHSWEKPVVTKEATCTTKGSRTYYCSCGMSYTEDIPATGHDYIQVERVDATCLAEGHIKYECSRCHDTKQEVLQKVIQHHWDNGQVVANSTCTSAGQKKYICTICGTSRYEDIKATGHTFGNMTVTVQPTINSEGVKERRCTVCGYREIYSIPAIAATGNFEVTNFPLQLKKSYTLKVNNMAAGDRVVSWKSSNTKIATVTGGGKITGKKAGKVTITAVLASGKVLNTKVTVKKKVNTSKVTVEGARTITLRVKQGYQIKAVRFPVTSQQRLTYSSSSKKVATVNKKGWISAKKAGKATITVKSGSKKVKITVKVTK